MLHDARKDRRRCPSNALPRAAAVALLVPLLAACAGPALTLPAADLWSGAATANAAAGSGTVDDAGNEAPPSQASQRTSPASAGSKPAAGNAATLAEARALRRSGDKTKAFALIDGAIGAMAVPDRAVLTEGGLLALDIGEPAKAEMLLQQASDPAKPDWRELSG